MRIVYFLYSAAVTVLLAIAVPWYAIRLLLGLRGHYVDTLRDRLGRAPADRPNRASQCGEGRSIWVHCVSVGEVLGARGLVRELLKRHPDTPLHLSTVTSTGQQVARQELPEVTSVFYYPIDHPIALNRALRWIRPGLMLIFETELWPNAIRLAKAHGARIALVNGRISDRSFPRYRRIRPFVAPVLGQIDLFTMQSAESAERVREMGAPPDRVRVLPNLKWQNGTPAADEDVSWRDELGIAAGRKVIVAGSTCAGEEEMVLDAYARVRSEVPGVVLVVAPRKQDRFREVGLLLERRGIEYGARSRAERGRDLILLDTFGELRSVYSIADAVLVGGSLVDAGGHNPLEPAACGKAVLFGPFMSNFKDVSRLLLGNEAAVQVSSTDELARELTRLLREPAAAARLGRRAAELVGSFSGAVAQTADLLDGLFAEKPCAR